MIPFISPIRALTFNFITRFIEKYITSKWLVLFLYFIMFYIDCLLMIFISFWNCYSAIFCHNMNGYSTIYGYNWCVFFLFFSTIVTIAIIGIKQVIEYIHQEKYVTWFERKFVYPYVSYVKFIVTVFLLGIAIVSFCLFNAPPLFFTLRGAWYLRCFVLLLCPAWLIPFRLDYSKFRSKIGLFIINVFIVTACMRLLLFVVLCFFAMNHRIPLRVNFFGNRLQDNNQVSDFSHKNKTTKKLEKRLRKIELKKIQEVGKTDISKGA